MSEPIQSIANGTYLIGETSQTEFQAGPGISITQPSEGTVRISNDETILFSDSSGVDGSNLPSGMVDMNTFKYVRITMSVFLRGINGYPKCTCTFSGDSPYFILTLTADTTMGSPDIAYVTLKNDGTSISFTSSSCRDSNGVLQNDKRYIRVYEVVGIN